MRSSGNVRGVWHTCESRKGDPAASGLALATTYRTASVMSWGLELRVLPFFHHTVHAALPTIILAEMAPMAYFATKLLVVGLVAGWLAGKIVHRAGVGLIVSTASATLPVSEKTQPRCNTPQALNNAARFSSAKTTSSSNSV